MTNDAQVKRSEMGKAGGVATLDSGGKVPSAQLPSYVDDVLEVRDFVGGKANIPTSGLTVGWLYYVTGEKKIYRATSATAVDGGSTPETGKIYVTADDNKTYRWSGSDLVEISKSIGLGETAGTAYDGKKGADLKKAYDAHAGNKSNPHGVTKAQVGLSNVTNDAQVKRSEVVDNYTRVRRDTSGTNVPSTGVTGKAIRLLEKSAPVVIDVWENEAKSITMESAVNKDGKIVYLHAQGKLAYLADGKYYHNWENDNADSPHRRNGESVLDPNTSQPLADKVYIYSGDALFDGVSTAKAAGIYVGKADDFGVSLERIATFTQVLNNLTTNDGMKALSAAQGKKLQDEKLSKTEASGTYLTKTSAEGTYAKKSDLGIVIE